MLRGMVNHSGEYFPEKFAKTLYYTELIAYICRKFMRCRSAFLKLRR